MIQVHQICRLFALLEAHLARYWAVARPVQLHIARDHDIVATLQAVLLTDGRRFRRRIRVRCVLVKVFYSLVI